MAYIKKYLFILLFLCFSSLIFSFNFLSLKWSFIDAQNENIIVKGTKKDANYIAFQSVSKEQYTNILSFTKEGTVTSKVKISNFNFIDFQILEENLYMLGTYNSAGTNFLSLICMDKDYNILFRKYYSKGNISPINIRTYGNELIITANSVSSEKSTLYLFTVDKYTNIIQENSYEFSMTVEIKDSVITNDMLYMTGFLDNKESKLDLFVKSINLKTKKFVLEKVWGAKYNEVGTKIIPSEGYLIIVGTNESFNEIKTRDVWVMKISATGDTVWSRIYDSSFIDEVNDACVDEAENIYITGTSITQESQDLFVLKLNKFGEKLYFDIDKDKETNLSSFIFEDSSNIVLGGYFINTDTGSDTSVSTGIIMVLN